MQIGDLHCDLLSYLMIDSKRTANDAVAQCSIPQMQQGGVAFQVLPIFTETTKGSAEQGAEQFACFQKILKTEKDKLYPFDPGVKLKPITVALAIENASGLLEETGEEINLCFERLEKMQREVGTIIYLSLTWNDENRFGGGNNSKIGLKKDGEALLDFLDQKKIAIDLSHASDWLAYDILNRIDKKGLQIQPIASHSNFRKIANTARNLPDKLALELIRRKGVIGINFLRCFIGESPSDFQKQLEHGLSLGGENALCLGADFFSEIDVESGQLDHLRPFFFPGFENSSCYPKLLTLLRASFPETFLKKLSHENLGRFLGT